MFKMFNNYNIDNSQSIKVNAVGGTILKNYKESFMVRFHMKSELAKQVFGQDAYLKRDGKSYPIVILQVMLCGEQELLAEIMWKEDFDKLFLNQDKECD